MRVAAQLSALGAVVLAWPSHAAIQQMTLGMGHSGSAPFDATAGAGKDTSDGDATVRSNDTVMHRAGYSLTTPDTNALIHLELGATATPAGYTGPANPKIAYFSVADIPTGAEGCANIQTAPVSNPPPAGQSGVTADGKHLFCFQPGPVSAANMLFNYRISGDAPNGATVGPLKYTFQSDNNPLKADPTVLNDPGHGTQPTHGNPTLTVTAAPRWTVKKESLFDGIFIPGSGPAGEDGYLIAYNIGLYSEGSRKGLEALQPDFSLSETFTNAGQPNLRLVTWDINNAFVRVNMGPGQQDGCGDWTSDMRRPGNVFDNMYHRPIDRGPGGMTTSIAAGSVANGGDCKATAVNDATSGGPKTATLNFTGVDSSLTHYPTQRGSNNNVPLINATNPDDAANQWWVASKLVLLWAPTNDFTAGVSETVDNTVELNAQSVTGQTATATSTGTAHVHRLDGVGMSKRYAPWPNNSRVGAYAGRDYAISDPNVTGDSHVNQVGPEQYLASRLVLNNIGTSASTSGYVCDRIDNARTTFAGIAGITQPTADSRYKIDANTGISYGVLAGSLDITFDLGVDGAGTTGGSWSSSTNVTNEYNYPATNQGAQANANCGDGDATWYPSIAALTAAGKSLQDVSRVRVRFPSGFGPAVTAHLYIPLKANSTHTFAVNNVDELGAPAGAVPAGTPTTGHIAPNQALWISSVAGPQRSADAMRIMQNEYIAIAKSEEPAATKGREVMRGATIGYKLQVNATSTTNAHTTDITVWDVLPEHQRYVAGSSMFNGAAIADPVCLAPGVTPAAPAPFAAGSVPAGYQACHWVLSNQPVVRAEAGHDSGNLPALTYKARISLVAPPGTRLLNSAYADSPTNTRNKATYGGAAGFACASAATPCSVSNWDVLVSAQAAVHLDKQVSHAVVPPNTGFNYTLHYSVVGDDLSGFRLLDVLPYSGDARGSSYAGALKLAAPIAAPVASGSLTADPAMVVLYTINAPANITRGDPYHASHNLSGTGANSATSTNWCTVAQFGSANCPATVGDATAFMAQAYGPGGLLPRGTEYELKVNVMADGNSLGASHRYVNNFVADSPTLLARRPGSNSVTTTVTGTPLTKLGGRVYTESNGNTTDDGHGVDPGIPGVTITLACASPALNASTTTNATGHYEFDNVPVGANCTLTETQPSGVQNAYATPDGAAPIAEAGAGNSAITLVVPDPAVRQAMLNLFAEKPAAALTTASISGRVYSETGGNTVDNGHGTDPGIPGAALALACTGPAYTASATAGADGSYSFANVPVGANCTVTQTQPPGYNNAYTASGGTTTPETGTGNSAIANIVVPAGGSSGNNFAENRTPGAPAVVSITGRVYVETGGNTTDNGPGVDTGIPGVTVELVCTAPAHGPVTATTGSDGSYAFANVPANATCKLTQTQPPGHRNAYTVSGGTPTVESGTANSVINITTPATGSSHNSFAELRSSPTGAVAVPTMGWPMLAAMSALLAGIGGWRRRRQAAA